VSPIATMSYHSAFKPRVKFSRTLIYVCARATACEFVSKRCHDNVTHTVSAVRLFVVDDVPQIVDS